MSKTAPIPDDVHALIVDKQTELKRRYKISVKISDIIAIVMRNNIDNIGKYLGLKNNEGDTTDGKTPEKSNVDITKNMEVKENEVPS